MSEQGNEGGFSWAHCGLRCTAKPWVTRGVACCLGAVSFLIVWSEATIASGTHPDLSPFSHVRPSPTPVQGYAAASPLEDARFLVLKHPGRPGRRKASGLQTWAYTMSQ